MAGDVKLGGGVTQALKQGQLGSLDPDAFAPQAHGLQANQQITPFPVDPLSVEIAAAGAFGAQAQTQTATQQGIGGAAGGDTEAVNSGNIGPMQG